MFLEDLESRGRQLARLPPQRGRRGFIVYDFHHTDSDMPNFENLAFGNVSYWIRWQHEDPERITPKLAAWYRDFLKDVWGTAFVGGRHL